MPLFFTKKEVFQWLIEGKKTIDIRKGNPHRGQIAVFQSGPKSLSMKIVRTQTGHLEAIVRPDNFIQVVPSAYGLGDAIVYVRALYGGCDGVFTAYYVEPLKANLRLS